MTDEIKNAELAHDERRRQQRNKALKNYRALRSGSAKPIDRLADQAPRDAPSPCLPSKKTIAEKLR